MAVAIAATNEQGDELAFYCRDCAFVFNSAPDGTGYEQVACPRCRQMCMTVEFENSEQERHHNEGVFFSILGALTGLLFHAHPHVHVPSRKLQLTLPKPVTIASYEHRADAESDLQVLAQKESKQLSIPFRKKAMGGLARITVLWPSSRCRLLMFFARERFFGRRTFHHVNQAEKNMRERNVALLVAILLSFTRVAAAQASPPHGAGMAKPGAVFNVLDHGVSAAAADNTAAIQAAINACQKAGGGIVEIPAGVFPLHRNAHDDLEPRVAPRRWTSRRDALLRQWRSRLHRRRQPHPTQAADRRRAS